MKNSKIALTLSLGFLLASPGLPGPAHATGAAETVVQAAAPPLGSRCVRRKGPTRLRSGRRLRSRWVQCPCLARGQQEVVRLPCE